MRLSKRMERYLRTDIGLSEFRLFAVLPQTKEDAVLLLVPRCAGGNGYCNMKYRNGSRWFGSVGQMLDECVIEGYIGKLRAGLLRHEYRKTLRRDNA